MSDLLTTAQDAVRDRCIDVFVGMHSALDSLATRAREQRGQTAAEYMGVLVVVAAIITAVSTTQIGRTIREAAINIINDIAGDAAPGGEGGGGNGGGGGNEGGGG